jgi:hypothetical protein
MYNKSLESKIYQLENHIAVVQDVVSSNQKRLGDIENRMTTIEKKEKDVKAESSFGDKVKKFFDVTPVQPVAPSTVPLFP